MTFPKKKVTNDLKHSLIFYKDQIFDQQEIRKLIEKNKP